MSRSSSASIQIFKSTYISLRAAYYRPKKQESLRFLLGVSECPPYIRALKVGGPLCYPGTSGNFQLMCARLLKSDLSDFCDV